MSRKSKKRWEATASGGKWWVIKMSAANTSIFSSITSTYTFSDPSDSPFTIAVSTVFQFHQFLLKGILQNPEKVFSWAQTALKAKSMLTTSIYSKIFEKPQAGCLAAQCRYCFQVPSWDMKYPGLLSEIQQDINVPKLSV